MNIHANDGISQSGVDALADFGFTLTTTNVAQEQLVNYINENNIVGILVRRATTVRKELIDACPGLKLIGRGGVGMENIDVAYAREKGLHVINTPAASSASVAELTIIEGRNHLLGDALHIRVFGLPRHHHQTVQNRQTGAYHGR